MAKVYLTAILWMEEIMHKLIDGLSLSTIQGGEGFHNRPQYLRRTCTIKSHQAAHIHHDISPHLFPRQYLSDHRGPARCRGIWWDVAR